MMRIHILAVVEDDGVWRRVWTHLGPLFGRLLQRERSLFGATPVRGEGTAGLYVVPYDDAAWRELAQWLACRRDKADKTPVIVLGDVPDRRRVLLKAWGVAEIAPLDRRASAVAVQVLTKSVEHIKRPARRPSSAVRAISPTPRPHRAPSSARLRARPALRAPTNPTPTRPVPVTRRRASTQPMIPALSANTEPGLPRRASAVTIPELPAFSETD